MNPDPIAPANGRRRPRWQKWLAGIFIGDLVVGLMFAGGSWLMQRAVVGLLGVPSLFLIPALGGLIASYFWRTLNPTIVGTCFNTLWMTLLALAAGTVVFQEGVICLLIVSPLFFASTLTGALIGRVLFKTYPTRLSLGFLPWLVLGVLAEPLIRGDHESCVTDEILIHAPASRVWPQLTSFPEISAPPRFWLFRLGLPYPVATTSTGDFVDAQRQCIFSHEAIFKERVIECVPEEKLAFAIVELPPDPELIGHLTPHRGEFRLRSNADGTTALIGSTFYTLHVRPRWYFDLWTKHIFRSVHLRVMEDIRRRAEPSPAGE